MYRDVCTAGTAETLMYLMYIQQIQQKKLMYLMYIQQVQQQYSKVQHSTAHSPRVDVLCMQYSKYNRYSRYSSTAQYSKVDVPPELWRQP